MPSRLLLEQFATEFPTFCKVGTGYNKNINKRALGFIAVSDSVHLLERIEFQAIFVDEAHHPLPPGMPSSRELLRFSATHRDTSDFEYSMDQAIEDGVLCDYDLYVPFVSGAHAYAGLVHLLLRHPGRFRRVLAYCNSVKEAKLVQRAFEEVGMAAWHINGGTDRKNREEVMQAFSGRMQKPVHVLVTVQVLGEGVNIPNADTCMFVEPRDSYTSIVQAVGRVLRQHMAKPLAHIILPAVTMPAEDHTPGGLNESGPMNSSNDAASSIQADSYSQTSGAHPLSQSLLVGSTTAFQKASSLTDATSEEPHGVKNSRSKSHPLEVVSANFPAAFLGKSDSEARAKSSQEPLKASCSRVRDVLRIPEYGPNTDEAEDNYDRLTTLDGSGRASAEARAARRASTVRPLPPLCLQDDSQAHAEHRTEEPLQDIQKRAGPGSINSGRSTSTITESTLRSPSLPEAMLAMQGREDGSAAPVTQHVATHHPVKLSEISGVQKDQRFSQLERFLSVLGRADSRLAVPHWRMLQSRICLVNCGSSAGIDTATAQGWFRLLAPILGNQDRFEARMQQLEDFVKMHGRLPFTKNRSPSEKQLSMWLKNSGYSIKQGGMAAEQKLQRFLASPAEPIRRRAMNWQTGGRLSIFNNRCSRLKDFIGQFQSLPSKSASADSESRRLAVFLENQRNLICRDQRRHARRQQCLKAVHPLVEHFLDAPFRDHKERFELRCLRLKQFIGHVGKLPCQKGPSAEVSLWWWLWSRRRKLKSLTTEQQSKLFNLHPLVCSYLQKKPRTRSSKRA